MIFPSCNAMLLRALKSNTSMWHVTIDQWETKPAEMEFYAERNNQIHAILEAPTDSVQFLKAWPRVFRAVHECSMESLFHFQSIDGSCCAGGSGIQKAAASRGSGKSRKQQREFGSAIQNAAGSRGYAVIQKAAASRGCAIQKAAAISRPYR